MKDEVFWQKYKGENFARESVYLICYEYDSVDLIPGDFLSKRKRRRVELIETGPNHGHLYSQRLERYIHPSEILYFVNVKIPWLDKEIDQVPPHYAQGTIE